MKTLIVFLVGFVVGSIGLTGTLNVVQHGLDKVQTVAKEASEK